MPDPAPSPAPNPAPSPAPAPAPAPQPSLLDPAPSPAPAPTSAFGDKWREELATGEDGKVNDDLLKKLQRYKSPKDFGSAHWSAVAKVIDGAKHEPLPEGATPEQVTAWRKANGIPEAPDKYDLALPDGLVIGEDDKPRLTGFLKAAHDANASPAFVKTALTWYFTEKEAELDARADLDRTAKEAAEEHLREVWGVDYKTNLNLIGGMIDTMPEAVRDQFRFARLADNTPMGANADVMNWLAGMARQVNPIGTVTPLGTGEASAAAETELKALRAEMGNPKSAYWVGSESKAKQARFAELSKALGAAKKKD